MLTPEPLTAAEALGLLVSLLQTGLIAWGIWLMARSNNDRKAIADTLNTHTDALRRLLEEQRPNQT